MSLKSQIMQLTERQAITSEIVKATGASVSYTNNIRAQMKKSGADVCTYEQRAPRPNTKSYMVYKFFLANPKARNSDSAKVLKVSRRLCEKVRARYFGVAESPKYFVKIKPQILPQPKAIFDVDLSELKL